MKRLPRIGERVSYSGSCAIGPCVGVVEHIHRPFHDRLRRFYTEDEFKPGKADDWSVRMKVDAIPAPWPYDERGIFAPSVDKLTPIMRGDGT